MREIRRKLMAVMKKHHMDIKELAEKCGMEEGRMERLLHGRGRLMEKITKAENLAEDLYGCMHSAVLDYGDYTVAVWNHCFKGSIAEVYELIETPAETGFGRCECRISLIERKEGFEDAGHAMAWALSKVK